MPQLDVYIIFELVYSVLIFFLILLLLNINNLIFNIYLNLKSVKLKYFIEKYLAYFIGKELISIKNNLYLNNIVLLKVQWFEKIQKNVFEKNIIDYIYTNKKINKKKNKNKIKNNLESYKDFI